jgi:hypothetical protein
MVRVLAFRLLENVRSVVVVVVAEEEVAVVVDTSTAVIDTPVEAEVITTHPDHAAIIRRVTAAIRATG